MAASLLGGRRGPLTFCPFASFPVALTDYGTIKKVRAPLAPAAGSCLLEEIELFPERRGDPIRSLQLLHSRSALFVGLQEHVAKIPLKRCQFHRTRR